MLGFRLHAAQQDQGHDTAGLTTPPPDQTGVMPPKCTVLLSVVPVML